MDKSALSNVMYLTSAYKGSDGDERCHICLEKKSLTREHVPPRSAFNNCTSLWSRLVGPNGSKDKGKRVQLKGGFWVKTLCADCNNGLCSPYASAYVKFMRHLVETPCLFDARGISRHVSVPADTLYIAKQIATMILAIEPASYAEHYGSLRHFVLNRESTFEPNFKVYAFLVPEWPNAGTITRYHGRIDTFAPGYKFMGGEISAFPLGFVYASEIGPGYGPGTLTDITRWFTSAEKSKRVGDTVQLYCRLTGVESIQCSLGQSRRNPQIDFV